LTLGAPPIRWILLKFHQLTGTPAKGFPLDIAASLIPFPAQQRLRAAGARTGRPSFMHRLKCLLPAGRAGRWSGAHSSVTITLCSVASVERKIRE